MFKIVVFSGGTGSVALQSGFSSVYGQNTYQIDVIVNAYDNGKSTGSCRRIFDSKILGPSDVRKNQLLQFSLQYAKAMEDSSSIKARLYNLFEARLSAENPMAYYQCACTELALHKDILNCTTYEYLLSLLNYFFFVDNRIAEESLRETVKCEQFKDFALSNVFYAACAAQYGNSLGAAAKRMADILGIKHNVHLISDKNLFLKAETQSGQIIEDEGDIVVWDNPDDKIVRAILEDDLGQEYFPTVGECSDDPHAVEQLVQQADVLIFSSGTQWSSLIPTYMHKGFREMIDHSPAKKYLIMNNAEDHDSYGVSANEMCGILSRYLDMGQITVVLNENAYESMRTITESYHFIKGKISAEGSKKHIPSELIKLIMSDYYRDVLPCKHQFFDLDGTLWNEKGTEEEKRIGRENLKMFQGTILTGNSISHVQKVFAKNMPVNKSIEIFADYGNSILKNSDFCSVTHLTEKYFLSEDLLRTIEAMSEFRDKLVTLRGGVVLTIKPVEDREFVVESLRRRLNDKKKLLITPAGRTSIDIMIDGYSKATMLKQIMRQRAMLDEDVLFIGNELERGSETEIAEMPIHTLSVGDVFDTYVYLKTRELIV